MNGTLRTLFFSPTHSSRKIALVLGESLTAAYTMHRNQQLDAELAAERQNKQNQERTTGSLSAQREGDGKSEIDKWWYEDD